MLLSVDPSTTCTGWALFTSQGMLDCCGFIRPRGDTLPKKVKEICDAVRAFADPHGLGVEDLIIEYPQFYSGPRSKGDPNKLAHLAALAGGLVIALDWGGCDFIKPAQWKGQVPKDIQFHSILKRLTLAELRRYNTCVGRDPDSMVIPGTRAQAGDALDAVGLGLWYLKRS